MDRNLALEVVRATEAAALSAARLMGRGDNDAADQAAVDAMRRALNSIAFQGTVVIGEGERDEAPMLYIGEKVGIGNGPHVDIALDPLEGTTLTAKGGPNALSVIALASHGDFLHAPDTYMEKLAVGPEAKGVIDITQSPEWNLKEIAKKKKCMVSDLTVIILERPRHEELIRRVREAGARIRLIPDGDVSAALATCWRQSGIDVLMGTGGAPEGVISAAALKCVGGEIQAILKFRNDSEMERARKMGISDFNKVYTIDELAGDNVMFAATGVTTGDFLKGVRFRAGGAKTHSIVMRSKTGTVRYIETEHHFDIKPVF
ncbi:MAG: class II fructose-bisphosphatase [Deltaproteobacteria bacterium]|nr:class II fructose-bisphosphatase [Deltaproteobacteria bacterium]MBI2501307.1 class II fructose-bisphosphatase [Deltaproteobacteria bacterium]MBI4196585.1 class II fructose-bisphosphatase [Deltaproteobacteria bacterium]